MTWSPGFTEVTPAPTSRTSPAPSWPSTEGKMPSLSKPSSVYASVWQMPVAMISTSTSPGLGPSRSSSTISSGCLGAKATAARVFIKQVSRKDGFGGQVPQRTALGKAVHVSDRALQNGDNKFLHRTDPPLSCGASTIFLVRRRGGAGAGESRTDYLSTRFG